MPLIVINSMPNVTHLTNLSSPRSDRFYLKYVLIEDFLTLLLNSFSSYLIGKFRWEPEYKMFCVQIHLCFYNELMVLCYHIVFAIDLTHV